MWFKHRAWIPIAWLLSLGNVVSVWFAALPAEPAHATIHALLAVLFGVGAQRLTSRRLTASRPTTGVSDDRLQHLEEAVDAIALEMERIGEGQRFVTKLLVERDPSLERPSELRRPDAQPVSRIPPPNDEK